MKNFFTLIFLTIILIISSESIHTQTNKENLTCPPSLISYWKLDEFGGINMFLDSFGGYNAACTGSDCPSEDSGIVGQARNFNVSKVTVQHNDAFNWDNDESFSIELWIKTTQPGTGNKVFIGKPSEGNAKMSWWLGYGDSNKTLFSVRDSTGARILAEGNKIINDGEWHHIVGIRNDSTDILQLFVDGVEEDKVTTFYTGDFSSTSAIYIGVFGNDFHYSGLLDEIAIYDGALNQNLIIQHYNAGAQGDGYCDQFIGVENAENIPVNYTLNQNYPNPFNPETNINFSIPEASEINLSVYNVLGMKIKDITTGFYERGIYNISFDGKDLTSGVYIYRLTAEARTSKIVKVKKMLLLK